ncbi:MAG: enoyl-CoA hydratase-related protein [Candidatus Binatia bacterium]|nr:enoyl-CoA hydratase-related protein [Candidatus Binatia bacterium]
MEFESVLYEVRDGVAHVTLNRPKAANAIDLAVAQQLAYAAMECDEDPSVRAVLIKAAPESKMFCAGGDLRSFGAAGDRTPILLKELTMYLHAAISRFARLRAPVIAAVNGAAAGAGFSLAVSTDLAICGESANFTMAYTAAGLTPDGSSTFFLPRVLGRRRTLELMISNRQLSAAEALDWGLVNRVVPDADLAVEAEKLATTLAAGPTEAYGLLKKLVLSDESLEGQMELEARAIADAARTSDGRAAIQAFLEKKRPTFEGR